MHISDGAPRKSSAKPVTPNFAGVSPERYAAEECDRFFDQHPELAGVRPVFEEWRKDKDGFAQKLQTLLRDQPQTNATDEYELPMPSDPRCPAPAAREIFSVPKARHFPDEDELAMPDAWPGRG